MAINYQILGQKTNLLFICALQKRAENLSAGKAIKPFVQKGITTIAEQNFLMLAKQLRTIVLGFLNMKVGNSLLTTLTNYKLDLSTSSLVETSIISPTSMSFHLANEIPHSKPCATSLTSSLKRFN